MGDPLIISIDAVAGVLYVKRVRAHIVDAREADSDSGLVLNMNESGETVGLQLQGALSIDTVWWRGHPDRAQLPEDLFSGVERWLTDHSRPIRQKTA